MSQEIFLDVTGLEPPEPMEKVLDALASLQPDQTVRMLIDREPRPLFRILDNSGYTYEVQPKDGYLYEILIRHRR